MRKNKLMVLGKKGIIERHYRADSVVLFSLKNEMAFFRFCLTKAEFCRLTLSDIEFKEKQISVYHQLQRTRDMRYVIEDTKTTSGTRIIPMTDEVCECFKRIDANRKKPKIEPMIDGYSGFLFLGKKDMPEVTLYWEKYFEWALNKHNRIYKEQLPKITSHVCRHTYCSNMAKSGMNPKTLCICSAYGLSSAINWANAAYAESLSSFAILRIRIQKGASP